MSWKSRDRVPRYFVLGPILHSKEVAAAWREEVAVTDIYVLVFTPGRP